MTAVEARKLSDDNKDAALGNILQKIEEAAGKGYIQITFAGFPDYISAALQSLGYSVNNYKVASAGTVDISW